METMKDFEKELERSFRTINEGDIISGTVIAVSEEEVTLDLNYYTQGVIKVENLSNDPDFNVFSDVAQGDVIEATVVKLDDGNGNIELSKKEANDILAWDKLKEMMDAEQVIKVRIKEAVNAGVVVIGYLKGRGSQLDQNSARKYSKALMTKIRERYNTEICKELKQNKVSCSEIIDFTYDALKEVLDN